jgi:uncharacterized protein (UPF0264 family)
LLDTFNKTRGPITAHLNSDALKRFTATCRENGVESAIAGGLRLEDSTWLKEVAPNVAGFRSAVSKKGRAEIGLDSDKIEGLLNAF